MSDCTYKRIDHFKQHLKLLSERSRHRISENIISSIRKDIKTKYLPYTPKNIRESLRRKGLNKYLSDIHSINYRLNRKSIPIIPFKTREKLMEMFKMVSDNWNGLTSRINFISYTFVIRKLCELLNLKNLIEIFPMLKSQELHACHMDIWKKICDTFGWTYIDDSYYKSTLIIQEYFRRYHQRKDLAARQIQKWWLGVYYDPKTQVCRKRLFRECIEINAEVTRF